MQNATKLLWIALCALILAACSSSSDDDDGADNTAPVIEDPTAGAAISIGSEQAFTSTIVASDEDGDALTFEIVQTDDSGALATTDIDGTTLSIGAPAVDADTVLSFTLTVSDGTATASVDFSITVTAPAIGGNTAPVVDPIADVSVESEESVEITLSATDAENDDVTFSVDPTDNAVLDGATLTISAPAVVEETTLTFNVTANDGTVDSAPVSFDVVVTVPVDPLATQIFDASVIFDGSVDTTAGSIEMVAAIPTDSGSFTAYYSQAIDANNSVGGDASAAVFEQEFGVDGALVDGSLVSGLVDIGDNQGDQAFAPDLLTAAEAVLTPNGTLLRPLQEQFAGSFRDGNGLSAFTEISLAQGSIDGTLDRATLPVIFASTAAISVTQSPVEQTFSAIGDDSLLAFSVRVNQEFNAAVDVDGQPDVLTNGMGPLDGLIDEVDVDSAALGNVASSQSAEPTTEIVAVIASADGTVTAQFDDLFAGEVLDAFDPTEPPNGDAFQSVFNLTLQGAAFSDGGATGGFVAVLGDLTNTLRMQVIATDGTVGPVVVLDDTVVNSEDNIAVATLSTGQVMIAWTTINNAPDPFNPIDLANETSVVAVVVNADGTLATDEFTIGGNNIFDPRIVATSDGRAVVSWFGGENGDTFAVQIIDVPALGESAAAGSNLALIIEGRVGDTENGAAGVELNGGEFVLSINDDDFVILVEDDDGVITFVD